MATNGALRFSCVASFEATHFFSPEVQRIILEREVGGMKSKTTALILSVLVGGLGVDRFYLGYTGMGVLKLLTAGCLGILWIIDIVNIATGKLLPADGSPYDDDTVASPRQQAQPDDIYKNLERAAKLHEQGVLTDEEFAKMKADLMSHI